MNFEYLEKTPSITYKWVPSQNGEETTNVVMDGLNAIGRITVDGQTYVGPVMKGLGLIYFDGMQEPWKISQSYEVLVASFVAPLTSFSVYAPVNCNYK